MQKGVIKGKEFTWHHFPELQEKDFEILEKEFKFHPLDFDDLRNDLELSKLDVYKYYLFAIFNIPVFDKNTMRVGKRNLAVFISKDYIVTATREPIESVDRFFARAKRSSGLKREAMGKTTGYFLYRLLDYIFRDAKVILHELVREVNQVEEAVYDARTRVATKRLGTVRRNVLFMQHVIDPHRILITQIVNARKSYIGKDLGIYFDDVKDTLDSMWVVINNLKSIVDGLFDVNEAFLSHRTNEIIRVLTVISVILMPPTLITGYYGMNVADLPLGDSVGLVSGIVVLSILICLFVVIRVDRRK
jgi:magnesium transporter